jgi:hypothetical protein
MVKGRRVHGKRPGGNLQFQELSGKAPESRGRNGHLHHSRTDPAVLRHLRGGVPGSLIQVYSSSPPCDSSKAFIAGRPAGPSPVSGYSLPVPSGKLQHRVPIRPIRGPVGGPQARALDS